MNTMHPSRLAGTTKLLLKGEGVEYGKVSTRVDQALALIDPERVASAAGILDLFDRDAGAVRGDRHLSTEGQDERIKSTAASRLENLAGVAKQVQQLETEYRADEGAALAQAMPEATTNDTLVDIALAGHALGMLQRGATDPKLLGEFSGLARNGSLRMRLALARMPTELSGLTEQQHMAVRHSLVPATVAARLDAEGQVISAARKAVQGAIDYLSGQAKAEQRTLVNLFGNGWHLRGSTTPADHEARAKRMLQGGAE